MKKEVSAENKMTKQKFHAYLKVQYSGEYNMIMQGNLAAMAAGLSKSDFVDIISNYEKYLEEFGEN